MQLRGLQTKLLGDVDVGLSLQIVVARPNRKMHEAMKSG